MKRLQLSWANLASYEEHSKGAEQRRPGRVPCERLSCESGKVLDLSRTGARLRVQAWRRPRKGEGRLLVFNTAMGRSNLFPCHIVWVRRIGWVRRIIWARFEIGVEFGELTEALQRELTEIARVHSDREWIHRPGERAA